MKLIQWYPGHMAKAVRMMEEAISLADAVVYVLDARAPASSYNKKLRLLAADKPVLYLLNKADLAGGDVDKLLFSLKNAGLVALKCNAANPSAKKNILAAMQSVTREKRERLLEKGSKKPIRFLIAGVPNTGKSTVLNLLCGTKKAATGDKAGVTRNGQWAKCGSFDLFDTPGVMPPSLDTQEHARRLAYLGSINDDILDIPELSLCLLEELREKYPAALSQRYGIEGGTPLEMLEALCARRGFVLKGGEYDFERGAFVLIDELRKGKLGKICLDEIKDLTEVGLI